MRHGVAVDREVFVGDDAARPLTAAGHRKMDEIVAGLGALELRFDRVLHSPWRRAAETAEHLLPRLTQVQTVCDALAQPPNGETIARLFALANGAQGVVLVGHEPFLSALLGMMLGPCDLSTDWRKGGIALLDCPAPHAPATLTAFVPSAWLRMLGRAAT